MDFYDEFNDNDCTGFTGDNVKPNSGVKLILTEQKKVESPSKMLQ